MIVRRGPQLYWMDDVKKSDVRGCLWGKEDGLCIIKVNGSRREYRNGV